MTFPGLSLPTAYDFDLDAAREMIAHSLRVPAPGDAGAHASQRCDLSVPTFVRAYWGRHGRAMTVRAAVRKLTFDSESTRKESIV